MSVGWSPGSEEAREMRDLFDRLGCRDFFLDAKPSRTMPMPRECRKILYSISFFVHEGAFDRKCDCSTTGSYSTGCDTYYGGCECKTLVVGRRCAACAPASFGFSSTGCKRCECQGSQEELCNEETGRCPECKIGFWNFPNCQKCQCNGNAFACDSRTGDCINCMDHTTGSFCERCKIGFYGNPILGIPCKPCPCPNTKSSGHTYNESCYLDETTREPICHCRTGYGGERCDICSDNYYGNLEIPGGECRMCNCSGNWEELTEGNCDPRTGQCLKCLWPTEGFNCEHCRAGYFGDATLGGMCSECTCYTLGTDPERFDCDRVSGECHCLPNVEGAMCDRCKENHWKIASGWGCEPCDCDPVGSTGPSCDLYTGQCNCKPGFEGGKCDQCGENGDAGLAAFLTIFAGLYYYGFI